MLELGQAQPALMNGASGKNRRPALGQDRWSLWPIRWRPSWRRGQRKRRRRRRALWQRADLSSSPVVKINRFLQGCFVVLAAQAAKRDLLAGKLP